MGKKAVPVARLKNDQNRRNTFKKRLVGLMKKIHDLSILCDVQIAAVVIDENKEIFPYTNNETIEEVWNQYFAKDRETKSNRLLECKKVLELETKKIEIACHAKKIPKQDMPPNVKPHHSIPQNVGVHYGVFQNNGVHHQPNWSINSNRPQYQISQGNTSSSMGTKQERNGNDWSNDTNGMNHGNTNHVNEVHQTLYYRTNGDNHQEYSYNIEVQGHEVQHQGYGYNVEVQGREVQHQSQANLQDPLDCPIGMDDNQRGYGYNVEVQGNEVHHQSPANLGDPLDHPIDVNVFEKENLAYTSFNVKSSNLEASGVTENIPSSRDLNIVVTNTPSTEASIFPGNDSSIGPSISGDAPSTGPSTQGDASYTRPLTSIEWGLMEEWEDWEDLHLDNLEDTEDSYELSDTFPLFDMPSTREEL